MLEKSLGNINVEKLRAILLLEANFNILYEIIFNNIFMSKLEIDKVISQKTVDSRRS